MIQLRFFLILLFTLLSASLQSCGGEESDSSKVTVQQIAEKPTVINSDFTVDPTPADTSSGDEIEVTGPWFPLRFYGTNGSNRSLTIASFTVESTPSNNGTPSSWVPDLGSATTLIQVAAGDSFEVTTTYYVDSLPESETKNYRVKVTLQGWFNDDDDPSTSIDESAIPSDSFEKTISFTTQ